jgi:hypothetical protein
MQARLLRGSSALAIVAVSLVACEEDWEPRQQHPKAAACRGAAAPHVTRVHDWVVAAEVRADGGAKAPAPVYGPPEDPWTTERAQGYTLRYQVERPLVFRYDFDSAEVDCGCLGFAARPVRQPADAGDRGLQCRSPSGPLTGVAVLNHAQHYTLVSDEYVELDPDLRGVVQRAPPPRAPAPSCPHGDPLCSFD